MHAAALLQSLLDCPVWGKGDCSRTCTLFLPSRQIDGPSSAWTVCACRNACASALLQFLLDYPVGERRLQQHLQFLITNLGYEHEAGRASAIELLQASQLCVHSVAPSRIAPAAGRTMASGPRWLPWASCGCKSLEGPTGLQQALAPELH